MRPPVPSKRQAPRKPDDKAQFRMDCQAAERGITAAMQALVQAGMPVGIVLFGAAGGAGRMLAGYAKAMPALADDAPLILEDMIRVMRKAAEGANGG